MKRFLNSNAQIKNVIDFVKAKGKAKGLALNFDDAFYKKLEGNFGKHKISNIIKYSRMSGYCYFYALILALGLKDCNLKIGTLHRLDKNVLDCYYVEFEHSWVEKNGLVYDTTLKQIIDKDFYYKMFEVEEIKSFSKEQLNDPSTVIKLGLTAITKRPELLDRFFQYEGISEIDAETLNKHLEIVQDQSLKKRILQTYEFVVNNSAEIEIYSKSESKENFIINVR